MKRLIGVMMCVFAFVAPNVSAHTTRHHHKRAVNNVIVNQCAGLPTQNMTVLNYAGVRNNKLLLVEQAIQRHSLSVRAHWNTPCVRFVPNGGWPILMTNGCRPATGGGTTCIIGGTHTFTDIPRAYVQTGALVYTGWAYVLDHEITEMNANPYRLATYYGQYGTQQLEVADPVSNLRVTVNGIDLSDFCFPSNFQSGGTWPFDEAHALTTGGN